MPAFVAGLIAGLVLGAVSAGLSLIRSRGEGGDAAAVCFLGNLIITGFAVTWPVTGYALPTATLAGVMLLIVIDLAIAFVITAIADLAAGGLSAAPVVMLAAVLAAGGYWIAGHNGPHDAHKAAYGIVSVTAEPGDALPASSTAHLVVVTPDEAATRASLAMSSGIAATRNFATYANPGPATLQRVDGQMWYVFQLEFDGAGNKARLHGVAPGYIMVSAEDPGGPGTVIERYDGPYSMVVSLGGGQGSEPLRYARDHGYSGYLLDDPTLEIQDGTGDPYFTVTLVAPQLGWTFPAPVGVLLINAHTGAITRYDLPGHGSNLLSAHAPWVDRVYSAAMAVRIANWYGRYAQAGWGGVGSTNANRFQVSGDPVLTYTGDENPSWRMLLTSFNAETSVYRIVEMDSATGAMRIYRPAQPMGIEPTVAQAFCNAQGPGAGNVRSNHLVPEDMTLHVIDGTLVWMASYESSQNNGGQGSATDQQQGDTPDPCGNGEAPAGAPSFTGIGFVPAYAATAANTVYGSTRAAALASLFTELAGAGNANGNSPSAGATEITVTGKLCGKAADVSGGNTVYYLTLCGAGGRPDDTRVYTGTSAAGPAIVLAQPGDAVVLRVLKATASSTQQQVQAFSDAQHPVTAGS